MDKKYLEVILFDEHTLIKYISEGEVLLERKHPIGLTYIEANNMRPRAAAQFFDGILYTLELISLYDRIPESIHVATLRHGPWFKHLLEHESYAQYYLPSKHVSVILLDTAHSPHYARHTKTFQAFKV